MLDLWAMATVDLRLDEDRFWQMAPVRFFALLDRMEKRDRGEWLRTGLIASLLYNPNRKKGKKAMKPEDFVPGARGGPTGKGPRMNQRKRGE